LKKFANYLVKSTGTGFVRMREEYTLTQDSDTWKVFELVRLRVIKGILIFLMIIRDSKL